MANAKSTTKEEPQVATASEGAVTSTPDNEAPEYEPVAPITVAERDALLNRPLVAPADESRVSAKSEKKPESGEEVQALLDEEAAKKAKKDAEE